MINKVMRNCDKCGKEDSINSINGLCQSCEDEEEKMEREKINNILKNGLFSWEDEKTISLDGTNYIVEVKEN